MNAFVQLAGRRPVSLRRCWLFVPGLDHVVQQDAQHSGADVLVADLAQLHCPEDRAAARLRAPSLMDECRIHGMVGAVRLSTLDDGGFDDLDAVMAGAPDAVLVPNMDRPDAVQALDQAIAALERRHGIPRGQTEIVPLFNPHQSLDDAYDLLMTSPRIGACMLADDAASDDAPASPQARHEARLRFLEICGQAGCLAIDGAYATKDVAWRNADLAWSRAAGFKAKRAACVTQVPAMHAAFTPCAQDVAQARGMVAQFDAQQRGMAAPGDAWVTLEACHAARRLLARHAEFQGWVAR